MGKMYELKSELENLIEQRGLNRFRTLGQVGMRCGCILGMVSKTTPDDDQRIQKMRHAIRLVVGVDL